MHVNNEVWALTLVFVAALVGIDFFIHRKPKEVSLKAAAWETGIWTALGLGFGAFVWAMFSHREGGQYFAGYLLERVLSVDNVFVFVVILSFFAVPSAYQHRALLWGVVGALVMRALFIFAGATLLERFEAMTYVFGIFLLYTAYKLARSGEEEVQPENNIVLKSLRRVTPMTLQYNGHRLFTHENGKRYATPMLAVLVVIGTTDLVFALDSIPAIFAITTESYLVFTSNAFALLGLRSMAFLLAGVMDRFVYLKHSLALVLGLVAIKMLLSHYWHPPIFASLGVIAIVLAAGVLASLIKTRSSSSIQGRDSKEQQK